MLVTCSISAKGLLGCAGVESDGTVKTAFYVFLYGYDLPLVGLAVAGGLKPGQTAVTFTTVMV